MNSQGSLIIQQDSLPFMYFTLAGDIIVLQAIRILLLETRQHFQVTKGKSRKTTNCSVQVEENLSNYIIKTCVKVD